jgi:hypothetical protein
MWNLCGVRDIRSLDPGALQIEFRMGYPGVLRDLAEAIPPGAQVRTMRRMALGYTNWKNLS